MTKLFVAASAYASAVSHDVRALFTHSESSVEQSSGPGVGATEVGDKVGETDGELVGTSVVGAKVGSLVGASVGSIACVVPGTRGDSARLRGFGTLSSVSVDQLATRVGTTGERAHHQQHLTSSRI